MSYRKQFGKRGGAVRRKTKDLPPVSRAHIGGLIEKAQRARDKALVAVLYLSGRRISELVGRTYRGDVWQGVYTDDFRIGKIKGKDVLRMRIRVLKRGCKDKGGLKEVFGFIDMRIDDPFTRYVLEWLQEVREGKVFPITRQRAWQIMHDLDEEIWNHWFRHQRLTHLSDTMDPFELKEFAKFARLETALSYVHKAPTKILTKVKEADELWK